MAKLIYIEKQVRNHPRAQNILKKLKCSNVVEINHFGEIFNRNSQNFRIQKENVNYIIAAKTNNMVIPVPSPTSAVKGYYFSHMYNCFYDCTYCFLQGLFNSAYHVYFVNYEDFGKEILNITKKTETNLWFFSGYDCDSLASEKVTEFTSYFVPLFSNLKNCLLEIRTKSGQAKRLLKYDAHPNIICAFSLNPQSVIDSYEKGTSSLLNRLNSMILLAKKGWNIGLRFDPIMLNCASKKQYIDLFEQALGSIPKKNIHSVSIGGFRLSENHHKKMKHIDPNNKLLFNEDYDYCDKLWALKPEFRETELSLHEHLKKLIPTSTIFMSS